MNKKTCLEQLHAVAAELQRAESYKLSAILYECIDYIETLIPRDH